MSGKITLENVKEIIDKLNISTKGNNKNEDNNKYIDSTRFGTVEDKTVVLVSTDSCDFFCKRKKQF